MSVSTHVLDASLGIPAAGIAVTLSGAAAGPDGGAAGLHGGAEGPDGGAEGADGGAAGPWAVLESGLTDGDGRYRFGAGTPPGTYRLAFATGGYFAARDVAAFYPEVIITFTVSGGHFHVPLLLSPFAYSTYRGS